MKKYYRWQAYSIIFTIAGLGIWAAFEDQERILASITQIGWQGFLFLCLFSSINYAIRYLRWNYLLKRLGNWINWRESLVCYLAGFALTTTPAKAGEVVRCLYLKQRHGVDYSHTLAALLTERTMDAISALLVGTLALYTFTSVRWVGIAFTLCIIIVVALVSQQRLLLQIVDIMRFIKWALFNRLLDLIPEFLSRTANLYASPSLVTGIVIGVFAWSAEGFAFAWLARELGGEGSIVLYMSIFCIAVVAGALTFIPGGLGGTEIIIYMLTIATGLGEAEALTATILIRLATLWYAVALGLVSLLWLESNEVERSLDRDSISPD